MTVSIRSTSRSLLTFLSQFLLSAPLLHCIIKKRLKEPWVTYFVSPAAPYPLYVMSYMIHKSTHFLHLSLTANTVDYGGTFTWYPDAVAWEIVLQLPDLIFNNHRERELFIYLALSTTAQNISWSFLPEWSPSPLMVLPIWIG